MVLTCRFLSLVYEEQAFFSFLKRLDDLAFPYTDTFQPILESDVLLN